MELQPSSPLSQAPLFEDLPKGDIDALTQRAHLRSFPRNAILVNEGDDTDSLYIIHTGKIKIFLSDTEGKEIILNIQGPGEYFGEIALLDEGPRSASVMTLEDCCFAVLRKKISLIL